MVVRPAVNRLIGVRLPVSQPYQSRLTVGRRPLKPEVEVRILGLVQSFIGGSSSGRTAGLEPAYGGSNPSPPARGFATPCDKRTSGPVPFGAADESIDETRERPVESPKPGNNWRPRQGNMSVKLKWYKRPVEARQT